MTQHARLSEAAASILRRLSAQTDAPPDKIVEEALKRCAQAQRKLKIRQNLEAHPWEASDRVDDLYEAGLNNTLPTLNLNSDPYR